MPLPCCSVFLQWLYYAYLAAVKEQDGAAMSMGRIDAFLDTYFEKDLQANKITELEVQELMDQFVMKLRIVRSVSINYIQQCASHITNGMRCDVVVLWQTLFSHLIPLVMSAVRLLQRL